MAVNGNVFTMADNNTETHTALCQQLAGLIHSASSDFEDIVASGMINPNAKYKFFRSSVPFFASDAERDTARRAVNQGFDITNATVSSTVDVTGIADKYDNADDYNGWEYLHPRGTSVNPPEYNRIRDMDGYKHDALPFIGGWSVPSRIAKDLNTQISATFIIPQEGTDSLTYRDFPAIENSYIGIALVAGDGTTQRLTSASPIKNAGISVELPSAGLAVGTYRVYPFFSSVKMTATDGNMIAPANVFTVPYVKGKTMVVAEKAIVIDVTSYYSGATRLTYTITVTNNSLGAITMTGNEVRHRLSGKNWDDLIATNETFVEGTPANFVIQGGETKKITGTITVKTSIVAGMQFMVQLNGNSDYRASRPVDQTIRPS